ncbi:GNAT family N-acetyltransferase [Rhizobium sullae]|uniref:GNAT family N-acetyltransferase n=1 Tax=Rhizobium sullae TaxID=50338 RepID=A0A2N0D636_RHISU|nr:GNAT family N-acetyltransferase [Rhizobium sullae]PKA41561.1 GNAT family N-acetyltransferase [Rhizobium sullae]UWU13202.1 GNAT family N-acetyltransferase [Rhizobium sullae]
MANNYIVKFTPEYEIDAPTTAQIAALLDESFPDTFDGRTYFKQLPHFRSLAFEGETVIGQAGVDHRVIRAGGKIIRIFGVIDLCVTPAHRGVGVAGDLLKQVESLALASNVDFLVLMGDVDTLYIANGFRRIDPAMTKWLAVEDVESVAVIERDLSDCFLVKPVRGESWPIGQIDMLGYLF